MTFLRMLAISLMLAGCAGMAEHREGLSLIKQGKNEEGLAQLAMAVDARPTDAEYRKDLYTQRSAHVGRLLQQAQSERAAGKSDAAEALYRRVLSVEAGNNRAKSGLEELARDRRHSAVVIDAQAALKADDPSRAALLLRPVVAENPVHAEALGLLREIDEREVKLRSVQPLLRSTYGKAINLEFREANVRSVFEGLARTTGINFILDKDVRPDLRTTIFLRNASIDDAVDLILQTSQLQRKILNANTVLIYPNTPDKVKEYQELMLKAFYLKNADVKQIQTTFKTLLKAKDIVIDEKLNLLVMRDTPDAIRLAEKLVAIHDIAEPEVMLDVEVLEIARSSLVNLGIQWPAKATLTPLSSTAGGSLTLSDLKGLDSTRVGLSIGGTVVNASQSDTDSNLLTNPRIRVRNREKAKILMGEKVPVVTTTSTATGVISDNIQYLDVGLKLEVEPDVRLLDEVAIKLGLEVSNIVNQITTPNGAVAYEIGTRNANTVLGLKDGETQILGGLISDQDAASGAGLPGLAALPVLGRLFGSRQNSQDKTEIVLSITPHVVRNIMRPTATASEFWSGTEQALRIKPLTLPPVKPSGTENHSPLPKASEESKTNEAAKIVNFTWQGPAQVRVGDTFKVALRMKTDGNVHSLPFQVAFDATALQVVSLSEGEFFKREGGSTSFSSNIDPTGKLFVSVTRSNVTGASGEEVVATVNLRALAQKKPAEIKLLAASPVAQGEKVPTAFMPPPYSVTIEP